MFFKYTNSLQVTQSISDIMWYKNIYEAFNFFCIHGFPEILSGCQRFSRTSGEVTTEHRDANCQSFAWIKKFNVIMNSYQKLILADFEEKNQIELKSDVITCFKLTRKC